MENLFDTQLTVEGKRVDYTVHFENETYLFKPVGAVAPEIRLTRDGETWVAANTVEESLQVSAISQLERYLLAQH